ncbi:MAG TPA: alpha/beta hydrolase [Stellaceae bacterium]|nr:alpha/beta hydrolase [Stellaceae bacterium]
MAASDDVRIEEVAYLDHGGRKLLAQLYRPSGPGPFPGIVEVHGGAWTRNDRLTNTAIHMPLAKSGAFVMAIDFRMPPEAQYPASICDVNFAVRWLKHHASDFRLRPELIGGLGTSSGGHQIMLSALRPRDPRYCTLPLAGAQHDASLAFVMMCWPIVDPLARYRMAEAKGNARLLEAHRDYWPDEAAMEDGNPQRILDRGEAGRLPPALLLQGTKDDNVTPDMADRFAASYRKAGGAIELRKFEGLPHAFIARDPEAPAAREAIAAITTFVRRQAS